MWQAVLSLVLINPKKGKGGSDKKVPSDTLASLSLELYCLPELPGAFCSTAGNPGAQQLADTHAAAH